MSAVPLSSEHPTAARSRDANSVARSALHWSAVAWLVPAVVGQWAFAYHTAAEYLAAAFAGNYADWNKRLFVGLVDGDPVGNAALAAHLFIAFFITVGGTLQLIPQIRTYAPAFHRWNGRFYILTAFVTSLAGLYMIGTRDTFGGIVTDIGVSLNAVLIMVFAGLTLHHAMARRIAVHQRWALRTFIAVSGVWFLRVIYAFLGLLPFETPGIAEDMTGPTNGIISFASYLLPLAVLELYFFARRSPSGSTKFAVTALLLAATVATAFGVYGSSMRWLS